MKNLSLRFLLLFILSLMVAFTLRAQDAITAVEPEDTLTVSQEEISRPETDTIRGIPLEVTRITEAFTESNSLIIESGKKHFTKVAINRYRKEVDTLFSTIHYLMADTVAIVKSGVSLRELDVITQQAEFYLGELKKLQKTLSDETEKLNGATKQLTSNREEWLGILNAVSANEIPQDRVDRINRTIHRLDSVKGLLQGDLLEILGQEDRLADRMNDIEQLQSWVEGQRVKVGERFFSRELPGLFDRQSEPVEEGLIAKHRSQIQKSFRTDYEIMKSKYRKPMGLVLMFLVIFMIYAFWFRKNYSRVILEKYKLSEFQKVLIQSPAVTVLFIVGLLIRFILPRLPHTYGSLNLMIMMIPMLIIIGRFYGKQIRNWFLLLALLCGLTFFYQLTYNPDILLRGVLLGFSLSAIALFLWLYIKRPLMNRAQVNIIFRLLRGMLLVFVVLLLIAVVANLEGAFSLAEFFTIIPIQIVLLAFGVVVAVSIADTLIYLLLASNFLQKVNIVKDDFDFIYKKAGNLANLLLWGLFFVISMNIFRIKDAVFEWVNGLFTNGIKVGDAEITLGSVAIFIFVIWVSIVVSKIIRHVLEKDVFPRMETGKGIPGTVTLLLRIILISSGFFLAAAAAGIKLSNLSIVLGAFSVGIGFGLQNIFNNMVSGLILALERPIKVGDVVQVGDLLGTVTSIGLRSSNVKSFDGAEVIVPNGNLISKEMINWTLSDSNRRMDIRVGVAYGSDTDAVIKILQEIALDHPQVDKFPNPSVYFTGFGDSSMDFRMLAWTNIDQRLAVESDLNRAIDKAFQKAGIEIPFPQRDLHIRSDQSSGK
jgi:potassium efflux system protein